MPQPKHKLKKRTFFSLLRDIAGHATTETVIMIPVFVAIWGGIWYTHQRHRLAINMLQQTRADTWQHAFEADCGGPSGTTRIQASDQDVGGGFVTGVTDLLFGGALLGMRIDEVEGRRSGSVQRPAVLGEGTANYETNLVIMCNEQTQGERGFWEVAWAMFFG